MRNKFHVAYKFYIDIKHHYFIFIFTRPLWAFCFLMRSGKSCQLGDEDIPTLMRVVVVATKQRTLERRRLAACRLVFTRQRLCDNHGDYQPRLIALMRLLRRKHLCLRVYGLPLRRRDKPNHQPWSRVTVTTRHTMEIIHADFERRLRHTDTLTATTINVVRRLHNISPATH